MIQSVGIVGAGNVAFQLGSALKKAGLTISYVHNRSKTNGEQLSQQLECEFIDDLSNLPDADLVILAISDDAITDIAQKITLPGILVHTSGSVALSELNRKNSGVFYALQTFKKEKETNWENIPFLIEGKTPIQEQELIHLANRLSTNVRPFSSEQRKKLHLAAVISCNFTNYLWSLSEEICNENNIDFSLLHPLIQETANKIRSSSPKMNQTGPAIRKDQKIIDEHLELLKKNESSHQLYKYISQLIQDQHS